MARSLLLEAALAALAALAAGARYSDYSAVNVPSYGGGTDYDGPREAPALDEYRDPRPQDASMALDYKSDDDPIGNFKLRSKETTDKEFEELDDWQQPEKNVKRRYKDSHENFDKYHATENIPSIRRFKRPLRHKARSVDDRENQHNEGDKYKMKNKDADGLDYFQNPDIRHEDKTNDFRVRNNYRNKQNIIKAKVRRKPRDKSDDPAIMMGDPNAPMNEDELSLFKKFVKENRQDLDDPTMDPLAMLDLPPQTASLGEMKKNKIKKPANYGEYDEYYDMKRVNSIKEKLPALLRRTTIKARNELERLFPRPSTEPERLSEREPERLPERNPDREPEREPERERETYREPNREPPSDDILWANRRMVPDPDIFLTTTEARKKPEIIQPPYGMGSRRMVPDPNLEMEANIPLPLEESTTASTSTTTTDTTTTQTTTVTTTPTTPSQEELSLAEKSRLSILKKAQRKESFGNVTVTTKPPVLLQVASKLQTVVMVEPPTSPDPLYRARFVAEDSPERLNQVKRMMRHKLVANAKSIRELTDNWDEMVCDYIDMSLLENSATVKSNSDVLFCAAVVLLSLL